MKKFSAISCKDARNDLQKCLTEVGSSVSELSKVGKFLGTKVWYRDSENGGEEICISCARKLTIHRFNRAVIVSCIWENSCFGHITYFETGIWIMENCSIRRHRGGFSRTYWTFFDIDASFRSRRQGETLYSSFSNRSGLTHSLKPTTKKVSFGLLLGKSWTYTAGLK